MKLLPDGPFAVTIVTMRNVTPGRLLTAREENFARLYATGLTPREAYEQAFDVAGREERSWVRAAFELARSKKVITRIRQLRDIHAADDIEAARRLKTHHWEILTADPREIIGVRVGACRYCHGVGHRYQWTPAEYERACIEALEAGNAPPVAEGGFGFNSTVTPHSACPECHGQGAPYPYINDTDNLSIGAALLFRGFKVTKEGIEIKLADPVAAARELMKLHNLDKTTVALEGGVVFDVARIDPNDPEAATRAYMEMMQAPLQLAGLTKPSDPFNDEASTGG